MVNVNASIEELSIKLTIPHKILMNLLFLGLSFVSSYMMACSFTLSVEKHQSCAGAERVRVCLSQETYSVSNRFPGQLFNKELDSL